MVGEPAGPRQAPGQEIRDTRSHQVAESLANITHAFGERIGGRATGLAMARAFLSESEQLEADQARDDRLREAQNQAQLVGLYINITGERQGVGPIRIDQILLQIDNAATYLAALQVVQPEDIRAQDSDIDQDSRIDIVDTLTNAHLDQLQREYDAVIKDEREPADYNRFIAHLKTIFAQLKKLKPSDRLNEADKQLEAAEHLYLGNYLELRNTGALTAPDSRNFGPAKWHTDASVEHYRKYWDRALAAVDTAMNNPYAGSIVMGALHNLAVCIRAAEIDIQTRIDSADEKHKAHYEALQSLIAEYAEIVQTKLASASSMQAEA